MKDRQTSRLQSVTEVVIVVVALAVAVFLRVQQLSIQVLLDDEWHAVHQLLTSGVAETFLSFGGSDHSIPLTLLYHLSSEVFGLSETLMRLPSVIFGIMFCGLLYVRVRTRFGASAALPALWLTALSTILIYYSRIARPYIISMTLCYLSLYLFERIYHSRQLLARPIMLAMYSVVTTLAVWTHPLVGLSVVSPYLYYSFVMIVNRDRAWRSNLAKLVIIAVPVMCLGSAIVLPPVLSDFGSLAGKMGSDVPGADTLMGAAHWWYGVRSAWVAWLAVGLTAVGITSAITRDRLVRHGLLATAVTALAIYITEPQWVHHGKTFARYLIMVVPIVIVSMACGMVVVSRYLAGQKLSVPIITVGSMVWIAIYIIDSPVRGDLDRPDNYVLHPIKYFELRKSSHVMEEYFGNFQVSRFWTHLSQTNSRPRVGVAPYYYRSDQWPAPMWQARVNAQVLPVALEGVCMRERKGEVPWTEELHFRNVVALSDPSEVKRKRLDYIVLNKPHEFRYNGKIRQIGVNLGGCRDVFEKRFGPPVYEDSLLVAYKLK